ncbi:hypothetical protein OIO90_001651 [Microbotryomycetes sp. JL221]|nr:hypothetical protein OIO90_001651 [Microbotryomycetes sp. JL221]
MSLTAASPTHSNQLSHQSPFEQAQRHSTFGDEDEAGSTRDTQPLNEQKSAPNEACIPCRSVKRRCQHQVDDMGTKLTCTRCTRLNIECKYGQMKRGRKSNAALAAARAAEAALIDGDSELRTEDNRSPRKRQNVRQMTNETDTGESSPLPGNSKGDWLHDMLSTLIVTSTSKGCPRTANVIELASGLPAPAPPPPPPTSSSSLPPPQSSQQSHQLLSRVIVEPIRRTSQYDADSMSSPRLPPASSVSPHTLAHMDSSTRGPPSASPGSLDMNGHPTAAGGQSPPHAPTMPGGFSLNKLLATRDVSAQARHSLAAAFGDHAMSTTQERTFQDIVAAGIIPIEAVTEMFDYFFAHLNPMMSLLDSTLHTAHFCRTKSAFLFSAILTAVTKVKYPSVFTTSMRHLNSLLGQAFEHGVHNIELVQALALASFWASPSDDSGAKKIAYAIRCAFELGCHKRAKRPLPDDDFEARLIMSRERTWTYLGIADHRFSTQRSLPRMIPAENRWDPVQWILENQRHRCPSDAGLGPLVGLGRLLDLYLALVNPDNGEVPNRTLLDCLETDCAHWTALWCGPRDSSAPIILMPSQASLIRFYAKLFRFQLDEVHLLISIKQPMTTMTDSTFFDAKQSPILTFHRCVKSALAVLESLRDELQVLVILYDSIHIGAASAAIWLVQNLTSMDFNDCHKVVKNLAESLTALKEKATDESNMATVTARLFGHLVDKASLAVAQRQGGNSMIGTQTQHSPEGYSSSTNANGPSTGVRNPVTRFPASSSSTNANGQSQVATDVNGRTAISATGLMGNRLHEDGGNNVSIDSTSWGALGDLAAMGPSLLMSNYFPDLNQTGSFFGGTGSSVMSKPNAVQTNPNGTGDGEAMNLWADDDATWQRLFPFFNNNPGF